MADSCAIIASVKNRGSASNGKDLHEDLLAIRSGQEEGIPELQVFAGKQLYGELQPCWQAAHAWAVKPMCAQFLWPLVRMLFWSAGRGGVLSLQLHLQPSPQISGHLCLFVYA